MPAEFAVVRPTWRPPAKNPTDEIGRVSLASTASCVRPETHEPLSGSSHATVGPFTTRMFTRLKVVYGISRLLTVLTFFDSWLSAATSRIEARPAGRRVSLWFGNGKTATPVDGL